MRFTIKNIYSAFLPIPSLSLNLSSSRFPLTTFVTHSLIDKMNTSAKNTETTPYEATQYNALAPKYQNIKRIPATYVETANVRAATAPFIHNARVLDLACGTGYYSRKLLEWGASSVVGVDVSEGMIDVASSSSSSSLTLTPQQVSDGSGKLKFQVGDARTLGVIEGGNFDLISAVWLLNYATNLSELTKMFSNISKNLKSGGGGGGVFVGLTTRPVPRAEMVPHKVLNDNIRVKKAETWGMDVRYCDLDDNDNRKLDGGLKGWRVEISTETKFGKEDGVAFTTFHLPMEDYETAAREGGMKGKLEWLEVKLEGEERKEAERDAGEQYFREYFGGLGPHFGILVIERGD